MRKVNVSELKNNFSRYLQEVESGKSFLVCRRNVPAAKIGPISRQMKRELAALLKQR